MTERAQVLGARCFVAAALATVLLSAGARAQDAASQEVSFPDVPRGHWASEAVNRLGQAGLIEGRPDGSFGGPRAMTRYELGVATARLFARGGGWGWSGEVEAPFPDVPSKHWAFWGLGKASHFGIVEGLPDGRFAGDSPMTRGGSAVAFARALSRIWEVRFSPVHRPPESVPPAQPEPEPKFQGEMFPDVSLKHWARAAAVRAVAAGIFEGKPDGRFHGEQAMTRYEFAVAVARLLDMGVVYAAQQAP